MTPKQAIEAFVLSVVQVEVQKLLPAVAKLIPGVAGSLVSGALQLQAVQDVIIKAETAGVDKVVELVADGIQKLGEFIETHVHGELQKVVAAALAAPMPLIHLTADEVRVIAAAVAAGKWSDVVADMKKDLGLAA